MLNDYKLSSGVGAGGSGAATSTTPAASAKLVRGVVRAVGLTYNDSPPSTTDVIVRTKGKNGPARTIFSLANANTSGWFDVVAAGRLSSSGATVTDPVNVPGVPVYDEVEVVIAQADDGDSVDVILLVSDN